MPTKITNPKISTLEPRWASFRGFSLLFDNPGQSYTAAEAGLVQLDYQHDDHLELYSGLEAFLQRIDVRFLQDNYQFCPLPFFSYHVTVWDGLNDGNAVQLSENERLALEALLEDMPALLRREDKFTAEAHRSRLVDQNWDIDLICSGLAKWSNQALVARLAPKNQHSKAALEKIAAYRRLLNQAYKRRFKVSMGDDYSPHVTLGYFANPDLAEGTTPLLDEWDRIIQETVASQACSFASISLYGFTDMINFLKAP